MDHAEEEPSEPLQTATLPPPHPLPAPDPTFGNEGGDAIQTQLLQLEKREVAETQKSRPPSIKLNQETGLLYDPKSHRPDVLFDQDTSAQDHYPSLPVSPAPTEVYVQRRLTTELFPRHIKCDLTVSFDNNEKWRKTRPNLDLGWFDTQSYKDLFTGIGTIRLKHVEETGRTHHEIYFRQGFFRVRGTDNVSPSVELDEEDNLQEKAIIAICKFIGHHSYEGFRLEVEFEYSAIRNQQKPNEKYSEMIFSEMFDKIQRNFADQEYISRADVKIFRQIHVIQKSLEEDPEFRVKPELEKRKTLFRIGTDAPRCHAISIWGRWELSRLLHWMDGGLSDINHVSSTHKCGFPSCEKQFQLFCKEQWKFFAHCFSPDNGHQDFAKELVLPIHFDKSTDPRNKDIVGSGASSIVYRVRIDPAHHYFSGDRNCEFALKVCYRRPASNQAAERERRVLELLADYPHPNVVRHLATWTQDHQYYFLYPLAAMNLAVYMKKTPKPNLSKTKVLWFLSTLKSLVSALKHIHMLRRPSLQDNRMLSVDGQAAQGTATFHFDLKPENILVFTNRDAPDAGPVLKISDFGSSHCSQLHSGFISNAISGAIGTTAYQGPEKAMKMKCSRPYDMWATGCVMLEFLLWFIMPKSEYPGREGFATERLRIGDGKTQTGDTFWYRGKTAPQLVPAVEERLQGLRRYCKGQRAFEDLITLVIKQLLVIDPKTRLTAEKVDSVLDGILKQAEADLRANRDLYLEDAESIGVMSLQPRGIGSDARSVASNTPDIAGLDVTIGGLGPQEQQHGTSSADLVGLGANHEAHADIARKAYHLDVDGA